MKNTNTKPLKMAVVTFCLVGIAMLVGLFGSYYLGLAGVSLVPFTYWQANDLWSGLYDDTCRAAVGAFAAAITAYVVARRMQDEKSHAAA